MYVFTLSDARLGGVGKEGIDELCSILTAFISYLYC